MSKRKKSGRIFRKPLAAIFLPGFIAAFVSAGPATGRSNTLQGKTAPAAGRHKENSAQENRGEPGESKPAEDFYIISSVNPAQHSLVLKLPTEVTVLMIVTARTVYLNESGKPIGLAELRAGDTVYVLHQRMRGGEETAVRIRKGPMTIEELHRRYLKFPER